MTEEIAEAYKPAKNPRAHSAKAVAGYQSGVTIGDGGHRYSSARWTPDRVDPEHQSCARCGVFDAPHSFPSRSRGWDYPVRLCGLCVEVATGRLPPQFSPAKRPG